MNFTAQKVSIYHNSSFFLYFLGLFSRWTEDEERFEIYIICRWQEIKIGIYNTILANLHSKSYWSFQRKPNWFWAFTLLYLRISNLQCLKERILRRWKNWTPMMWRKLTQIALSNQLAGLTNPIKNFIEVNWAHIEFNPEIDSNLELVIISEIIANNPAETLSCCPCPKISREELEKPDIEMINPLITLRCKPF